MDGGRLYMGIDGGGTRTTILVTDAKGNVLSKRVGADTNFYISGLQESRKKLQFIVEDISREVDLRKLAHVFIGSSAVDYTVDEKTVRAYTENILECKVTMKSDAYVALAGHTLGEKGNLVISGTGSVGIAMNEQGEVKLAGGWGHLLGDDGSAYDIALKGIRAAVKSFDGLERDTLLTEELMEMYQLKVPYDLLQFITPDTSRTQIAAFAETVKKCADQGDVVSIRVLEEAAHYLARLGAEISNFSGDTAIAIYGSVLLKDAIVQKYFIEEYCRMVPGGVVTKPRLPAEAGAVILAMKADGREISDEIVQTMQVQIA